MCRRRRPRSRSPIPLQRPITRYLEATGNTAAIKSVDLVARVQGFLASHRLQGRHLRQGRHHAVHDRARDLQAEARPGAGGRGRRAGHAEAGRGRLQAAERSRRATGGVAGHPRYVDLDARQRAGQSAAGAGQHQDRRGQLRLYQGRRRRSTASSPRIMVSVGELVGVTSPTQLATIVALDPIYVNFNVNEQDVMTRPRRSAPPRHAHRPT